MVSLVLLITQCFHWSVIIHSQWRRNTAEERKLKEQVDVFSVASAILDFSRVCFSWLTINQKRRGPLALCINWNYLCYMGRKWYCLCWLNYWYEQIQLVNSLSWKSKRYLVCNLKEDCRMDQLKYCDINSCTKMFSYPNKAGRYYRSKTWWKPVFL